MNYLLVRRHFSVVMSTILGGVSTPPKKLKLCKISELLEAKLVKY